MSSSDRNLVFLLGSGISIPAGLPSTSDITDRVLAGKDISRHTDTTYFEGQLLYGLRDEYVPTVIAFLNRLKSEIDQYYSDYLYRTTNYEDLYSLASQIHDSESGQFDNPALGQLIKQIREDSARILLGKPHNPEATWQLINITTESTNYIRDVVRIELSKRPVNLTYLDLLKDLLFDSKWKKKLIFTLNHDTLLETFFLQHSIQFVDGFETRTPDFRTWNPSLFEQENMPPVYLFKLHGSITWFHFENSGTYTLALPAIEFWQKNPTVAPVEGRPEILVGTLNKILQYSNPIYMDLQCCFHRLLKSCDRLLICGYGFGDKAINARILQWMDSSVAPKLIIIHPDSEALLRHARVAVKNVWPSWQRSGRVLTINKRIEDTTLRDINEVL